MQVRRAHVQSMETPASIACDTVAELIDRGKSEGHKEHVGKLALALRGTEEFFYTRYYIFLTDKEREDIANEIAKLRLTATTERYIFKLYSFDIGSETGYMAVVTPNESI